MFDSGVGGLTVARALQRLLPQETLCYLGDTARLPYGTKSPAVVQRYAAACARFLCGPRAPLPAKLLLVACNTASAHALPQLTAALPLPVLGVIEPGVQAALRCSRNRRIGVLATAGTVDSGSYARALRRHDPEVQVFSAACPLFVPLAEENLGHHPATALFVADYLQPLLLAGIDTLILGCTHYPLLLPALRAYVGPEINLVDGAAAAAQTAQALLQGRGELATCRGGANRFFATDVNDRLLRTGRAFWGAELGHVEWVDIEAALAGEPLI